MRAAYTGNETLTFTQYIDRGTGRTLRADPGGVYDIMPASGHVVPEIPTGWFAPVEWEPAPFTPVALRPDGEPEPEPEVAPEPEQDQPEG